MFSQKQLESEIEAQVRRVLTAKYANENLLGVEARIEEGVCVWSAFLGKTRVEDVVYIGTEDRLYALRVLRISVAYKISLATRPHKNLVYELENLYPEYPDAKNLRELVVRQWKKEIKDAATLKGIARRLKRLRN